MLRGPQGTLYGSSAMGGLIKYVSKAPDTNKFSGDVQVGVSDTESGGINYNVAAAVNLPIITNEAGLRVSGYQSHDGGYIDNVAVGQKDVNRSNVNGGRLDLLLTPTDALTVRLIGFLQDITREGEGTADYTFSGAQPYGQLDQFRRVAEPFDQHFRLVAGTLVYDFGLATLTSSSSYQTKHEDYTWDVSSGFAGLCITYTPTHFACSTVGDPVASGTNKFTQEIRLASKENTRVEWLIGGFYTLENSTINEHFDLGGLAGQPEPNTLFTYYVPSRFEEYAAFGDLTWHLTTKLDVTGGIRYARDNQSFLQDGSGTFAPSQPPTKSTENVETYLGNLRYHFSDNATGYLRYATGYRPGGPTYSTVDPTTHLPNGPAAFQPDNLKSYEVGYKAETSDRRFDVDVAVYDIDWKSLQITVNRGGFSAITNATSGATIQGAELAVAARPVRGFSVTGNFAYQHAYMTDADAGLGAARGERLPNVPRFTANLNADYQFTDVTLQPVVGASARYLSDRNVSFDASQSYPQYHLPANTIVDLRASALLTANSERPVNLQLYVHNVFNELAPLSIITPQFGARVAVPQPRTVGVTLTMKF